MADLAMAGVGRLHSVFADSRPGAASRVEKVGMTVELTRTATMDATGSDQAARSDARALRRLAVTLGLAWSALFVLVGLVFRLQLYGDGSIFSYSIAVQAGWGYHFHNIADRMFVYAFSHLPAEAYVALTRDARGGIFLYGLLFFAAPLAGLLATFAADRSPNRTIFAFACLSTACLCPLVFGFPTEMWVAHSAFWPALALGHCAGRGAAGTIALFAAMLALALSHEGGLVFAGVVAVTVGPRGLRDGAFLRAVGMFVAVLGAWIAVKMTLPPGDYYASIIPAAATNFFDLHRLVESDLFKLLAAALAGYGIAFLLLRRVAPAPAPVWAFGLVALALATYWLWFDHALHTQNRYYVRTAIFFATPMLGGLAALRALRAEDRLRLPAHWMQRVAALLADGVVALGQGPAARAAAGAILVLTLAYAVETAKFVTGWTRYEAAVRGLAMGAASDPALGDPRFVSSDRIDPDSNRLQWQTTTPFLSVLVAPGFLPNRLVVDPSAGYFWLTCERAAATERADRAVPVESRRLIRVYSCLHR
jgi:hypothetical protein